MNAGDTLIVPRKTQGVDGHLWVVISDPLNYPEQVLMVSLTSFDKDKDQACELSPGEHPFVTRRTLICYNDARVAANSQLESLVSRGLMHKHDSVSPELLKRIRDGAWESVDIPLDRRQILIDQGVI